MCGRMNITDNEGILLLMDMIGMPSWPSIEARYNVAPTQTLDVVIDRGSPGSALLQHQPMHWGLIPGWAKKGQFKRPLINARSETVREKPSFRHLVDAHRAVVPITGFYEWLREGDKKRPYYIHPGNAGAMLLAALYQENAEGIYEVTLLTTGANSSMSKVHDRMPVILNPEDAGLWLTPENSDRVDTLMKPAANDFLAMHEVSSYVSNARNTGPECMEPLQASG